jgi:hypothetical protein
MIIFIEKQEERPFFKNFLKIRAIFCEICPFKRRMDVAHLITGSRRFAWRSGYIQWFDSPNRTTRTGRGKRAGELGGVPDR